MNTTTQSRNVANDPQQHMEKHADFNCSIGPAASSNMSQETHKTCRIRVWVQDARAWQIRGCRTVGRLPLNRRTSFLGGAELWGRFQRGDMAFCRRLFQVPRGLGFASDRWAPGGHADASVIKACQTRPSSHNHLASYFCLMSISLGKTVLLSVGYIIGPNCRGIRIDWPCCFIGFCQNLMGFASVCFLVVS